MPKFKYITTSKTGKRVTGEYDAESSDEVVDILHKKGLIVVSIREDLSIKWSNLAQIQIGKLALKKRMLIVKQMATMLGAGVPLVQALDVLVQQSQIPSQKKEFTEVFKDVQGGMTLSKAFQKSSHIFDDLQISLLEAGEKSGNLVEILHQITVDMEKSSNLISKIKGAMIYPTIIFIGIIGVMAFMVMFLVPAVKGLYADLGLKELPAITQMFVDLSNFLMNPLGLALTIILLIGLVIGYRAYYSSRSGKYLIDKLLLKVPIFGVLIKYSQIVQSTRLLAMLNRSGVPIIDALNTVAKSLSNIHYRSALENAAISVSKGAALAPSLAKGGVFPFILVKMISIGEDTGSLEKMLDDMSDFYNTELNEMADNLTKLMEPIILVVFGTMVGFLAVAIYLPIYSITQ